MLILLIGDADEDGDLSVQQYVDKMKNMKDEEILDIQNEFY